MKSTTCAFALALFTGLPAMQAQNLSAVVTEVKQSYETVKNNLLKSAEKVPDEDYSFKPTPEVRSFGEVVGHVIAAQGHTCAAILGEQGFAFEHEYKGRNCFSLERFVCGVRQGLRITHRREGDRNG